MEPCFPVCCVFKMINRNSFCQFSHVLFFYFSGMALCCCFLIVVPLLQRFMEHRCSIRTCPNGIRVRCQLCEAVSAISASLCGHAFRIGSQFSHVPLFCCFWTGTFFVVAVVLSLLLSPSSSSVWGSKSIQFRRVKMEYGRGERYGFK